jgi:hypothetical protein
VGDLGVHLAGEREAPEGEGGVEHGHRQDAPGIEERHLEADGASRVVEDEVVPVDAQRVEGARRPPAQTADPVVEAVGPFGETESGEVEGHAAQATGGQLGQDPPVQERRRREPVHADDGLPVALGAHEAAHPAGREPGAGIAVGFDGVVGAHPGEHGRVPVVRNHPIGVTPTLRLGS